jgi:hypothetical protein
MTTIDDDFAKPSVGSPDRGRRVLAVTALIVSFFAGFFVSRFFQEHPLWMHLQTLESSGRDHRADLWRIDSGVDRNYRVDVDGTKVFSSNDFAPRLDIPYRETLCWDRSGHVVILEIAGHRVFGYDVAAGRRLSDPELLAAEAPPELPLWEYSGETEWPGIGRVPVPDDRR